MGEQEWREMGIVDTVTMQSSIDLSVRRTGILLVYIKCIIIFFSVTKYCVLIHFLYDRKFLKFDMRNTTSYNDPIAKLM